MQNIQSHVFSIADLKKFPSGEAFLAGLNRKKHFSVEGISRIFSTRIFKHVSDLQFFVPDFTLQHGDNTYVISRQLITRVSIFFKDDSVDKDRYQVPATVSQIGLELLIDVSQGRRMHLDRFDHEQLCGIAADAVFFGSAKIQEHIAEIFMHASSQLQTRALIDYFSSVHKVTHAYKSVFAEFFSRSLQTLIFRSQYDEDHTELDFLISKLKKYHIRLVLDLKNWTSNPVILDKITNLNIRSLSLRDGVIDLSQFPKLHHLRGHAANFTHLKSCVNLKVLHIDHLPAELPPNLEELWLRETIPSQEAFAKLNTIRKVFLNRAVDASSELMTLTAQNICGIKILSRTSMGADLVARICEWPLTNLSLERVTISPTLRNVQPLEKLRDVVLSECDSQTMRWILGSTELERLRLKTDEDVFENLPLSLIELSLEYNQSTQGLRKLSRLTNLRTLRLTDIKWSEGGLQVLNGLASTLQSLSIHVSGAFLPGDISFLENFSKLTAFSCDSQSNTFWPTTEEELNVLSQLPLKTLKIKPDASLIPKLNILQKLEKTLTTLDLFGTSELDWPHLPTLSQLQRLQLRGCRWMNVNESCSFAGFPSLRHLEVSHIKGDIKSFLTKLPSIELVLDS